MNINVQQFPLNHRPTGPSYAFEPRLIRVPFERVVSGLGAIAPQFGLVVAPPAGVVSDPTAPAFVAHARHTRADGRSVTLVLHVERHPEGTVIAFGSCSDDAPPPAPVPASLPQYARAFTGCLFILYAAWAARVSVGWWLLIVVVCVAGFVASVQPVVPEVEPYNPLLAVLDANSDERRFARALLAALEERLSR